VTLVVVGEVREKFTVGVYAVAHYIPSARGKEQFYSDSLNHNYSIVRYVMYVIISYSVHSCIHVQLLCMHVLCISEAMHVLYRINE